ncbi:hypothetical protein OZ664_08355 [Elizabethkingia sp. HX WHF]|uniref:hypothetical protein n=1 Tax=Elizabethkingia TaxID=308865 RepID=UPI0009993B34|nr:MULTISPECIES: hypothetical protein [Elizabethkingia]ATL44925.1 hypothetical protein CQS02_17230 [Elizabethkingia miricola]MCL1636681.1 hypothetical protein [Elizabethkingia bruuniana]MDX8564008.1 hypothetical protein [Elizabethkingia sp. HX WHF]OPC18772.1 hypothetical protein BAY00_13240 [Elizabethkingia bruuniana]
MDELELLKKDWNKDSVDFKTYSAKDVYNMIRKKTLSIVNILLLIGLSEALLWTIYYYMETSVSILRLIIFILFLILILYFYYKLNANNDVKMLMKNIFRLRKIILGYAAISGILIVSDNIINYKNNLQYAMAGFIEGWKGLPMNSIDPKSYIPSLISYILYGIGVFFILYIIYFIYKKTYGNILHKLRANYKELTKLEESNA